MKSELEKTIEGHFMRCVKLRKGLTFKFVVPGFRGLPDRIAFMPGGVLLLCELKRPSGGVLYPWQARLQDKLRKLGFPVHEANTKEKVDHVFEAYDKADSRKPA